MGGAQRQHLPDPQSRIGDEVDKAPRVGPKIAAVTGPGRLVGCSNTRRGAGARRRNSRVVGAVLAHDAATIRSATTTRDHLRQVGRSFHVQRLVEVGQVHAIQLVKLVHGG